MNPTQVLLLQAVIILGVGALAVWLGGPIVEAVFRKVSRPAPVAEGVEAAEHESPDVTGAAEVLQGGMWIGRLERLAVYAAIVTGFGEGVAIALAIKGIGRYPELNTGNKSAAERFIIGTFVSMLVAGLLGGLARLLLSLI